MFDIFPGFPNRFWQIATCPSPHLSGRLNQSLLELLNNPARRVVGDRRGRGDSKGPTSAALHHHQQTGGATCASGLQMINATTSIESKAVVKFAQEHRGETGRSDVAFRWFVEELFLPWCIPCWCDVTVKVCNAGSNKHTLTLPKCVSWRCFTALYGPCFGIFTRLHWQGSNNIEFPVFFIGSINVGSNIGHHWISLKFLPVFFLFGLICLLSVFV